MLRPRDILVLTPDIEGTPDWFAPSLNTLSTPAEQARTQIGKTKQEAVAAAPGAPWIVSTGGTLFGDVKVRHRRLWEKLARRGRG